jgi:ribosomal protein S18 acetylase RimI-like enzyme
LNDLLDLLPLSNAEEFKISGFDPDHLRGMINRLYGKAGRFLRGLLRLLGREPLKFLVAEVDGKIVGTTVVEGRGKAGFISAVMVHPGYRRRGIAMRLMVNALDYLRGRKKVRAVLGVISTNAPAIDLYLKLGFKAFDHTGYFIGDTDTLRDSQQIGRVQIRPFQNGDLSAVYDLVVASEDPVRLNIRGFGKKNLKTPFLGRFFRFSNMMKIVAVVDGRIVGYAEASYTTPNEVGRIGFVHVDPEGRQLGVDRMLVDAARKEIEKGNVRRFRLVLPTSSQELIETVKEIGFREALVIDEMVVELDRPA